MKRYGLITASAVLLAATAAEAATITIDFNGVVEEIALPAVHGGGLTEGLVAQDVVVGDDVSGRIVIDDAAPVSFATAEFASYTPADGLFELMIGGRSYASGMVIVNVEDDSPFYGDTVRISGYAPTGPAFAGNAPGRLQFSVGALTQNLFDGVAHPDAAALQAIADADEVIRTQNLVSFGSPLAQDGTYWFGLTSVEVSGDTDPAAVPLPASALFLGVGLLGLAPLARRRG